LERFACLGVEDLNGIVSKGSHEQPLPGDVDGHMVNSPFDFFHGNRLVEGKRHNCLLCMSAGREAEGDKKSVE
jgi:hypothetical protein